MEGTSFAISYPLQGPSDWQMRLRDQTDDFELEVHFVEDGGLRLPSRIEHGDAHLALMVPDDRFRSRLLYPVHNLAVLPRKQQTKSVSHARRR